VLFVLLGNNVPVSQGLLHGNSEKTLDEQGVPDRVIPQYYSVKEVVLSFAKLPGVLIRSSGQKFALPNKSYGGLS
jgi:carbamoyl-phosphate synthase large subunit